MKFFHNRLKFERDNQGAYFTLGDDIVELRLPPEIDPGMIEEITYTLFPLMKQARQPGLYRYQSAWVIPEVFGSGSCWKLLIHCKNPKDAEELLFLFGEGTIFPERKLEGGQADSSARALKELWREALGIVKRCIAAQFRKLIPKR